VDLVGPAFPTDALPDGIRDFVAAQAVALQVPPDLVGCLVLGVGAAAAIGRSVVRLNPEWAEPLNLFVVPVLPSGERKSPVFRDLVKPLQERERELAELAKPETAESQAQRDVLEQRLQAAKRRAATGKEHERKAATPEVADLARSLAEFQVLRIPRLLAGDATAEAVSSLLADHGGRMAVMSTEGGLFETLAGRYSQGILNIDVYLKGYSGDPIRVDRKSRPPEYVPRPSLTLVLTVQPAVIADLALKPGFRGRGLLARFLYSVPGTLVGYRSSDPPHVPAALRCAWDETVRAILRLPVLPQGDERALRLSPDGRAAFREFRDEVEAKLRPGGDLDGIEDWGNKLAGTVARLMGILHLFQHAAHGRPWETQIACETVDKAIRLGRYFADHAKVAFGMMGADPAIADAKHVLAWIKRTGASSFTKQEVWQATKGRFANVALLDAALRVLEERGYLRKERVDHPARGRPPAPKFQVNPHVASYNPYNPYNSASLGNSRDCRDSRTGESDGGRRSTDLRESPARKRVSL